MKNVCPNYMYPICERALHSHYVQLVAQLKKHLCIQCINSQLLKALSNNNVVFTGNTLYILMANSGTEYTSISAAIYYLQILFL